MGELHLIFIVDRMRREFKVEANVGAPQVAYRETFREPAELKENSFVNLVVVDNTVTFGLNLNQMKKEKDLNLKTTLLVELFLVNIFRLFKRYLKMHDNVEYLLDIPLVDIKATLLMVHTMMLTHLKWRLKLLLLMA